MASTLQRVYKRYNGTDWDKVYFVTSAGIVKETENRIFVHVSNNQYKGTYTEWQVGTVAKAYGDIVNVGNTYYFLDLNTYENDVQYQQGDKVIYQNGSQWGIYSCEVTPVSAGVAPSNTSYWAEITLATNPTTCGFLTFDLSKPGSSTNHGHFSPSQANRLGELTKVTVLYPKTGVIEIDGVTKQIIPDNNVVSDGNTHTAGKVPVWGAGGNDVLDSGLTVSNTGGTGHGGVLVQTNTNGKIDVSFIPDSVLGSLKYKGTWNASSVPSAYSSSTAYSIGDIVTSSNVAYICIKAGTGKTPASNPDYWQTFSQGDYLICSTPGIYNPDGSTPSTYNSATTYASGDKVLYNSKLYRSLQGSNTNHTPGASGSDAYWEEYRYELGDWAIYNGTTWDEIDNQTKVVSVNNRTGIVSVYQGNFTQGVTYQKGDIVYYSGDSSLYICTQDNNQASTSPDATGGFKRLSSPLYSSIGSATDGAMTQKATTDEFSLRTEREIQRTYLVSGSGNYFERISGPNSSGDPVALSNYTTDVTTASSTPSWSVLAGYFLNVLNIKGSYQSSVDALFISSTKNGYVQNTMSTALKSWFTIIDTRIVISSFRVIANYHDVTIIANTSIGREYKLHIVDTSGNNADWSTYNCPGWLPINEMFLGATSNYNGVAITGDVCYEEI